MVLTEKERDKLFREAQFAAQKAMKSLEKADKEVAKCKDINVRDTCKAAIQAAIASFAASKNKQRVIITALGVLAHYAGKAYDHICKARNHLKDAKKYAKHSDDCQERLWRDK